MECTCVCSPTPSPNTTHTLDRSIVVPTSSSFTVAAFPTRARLPFFCLLLFAVGASFLLATFFAIGFFATGFAAGAWELLLWGRFGGGFTPCFRCDQALSRFGQWTPFGEVKE